MRFLDVTLESPAENVSFDEELLLRAERAFDPFSIKTNVADVSDDVEYDSAAGDLGEVVRVWESPSPVVVVGRSTNIEIEVNEPLCRERGIPVVRRASGGATIVAGPGCLMYAVVLSYRKRPALRAIDFAHAFVLGALVESLGRRLPGVARQGISDLTWNGRKFSGNALRCKREHVLYHGTLLYDFPLSLISELLKTPPRQPKYRAGRSHGDFIGNLPLTAATLRTAVQAAFLGRP